MIPDVTFGDAALVFTLTSTLLLLVICVFSWLVRPIKPNPEAEETYECGMEAVGSHRDLGFNFIGYATLFLVFDLAALYLFMYAVAGSVPTSVTLGFFSGIVTLLLLIFYGTQKRRYYVA